MPAQIYATEITSEGETMRVRVAAHLLDARIDLEVVVETQNADIALECEPPSCAIEVSTCDGSDWRPSQCGG